MYSLNYASFQYWVKKYKLFQEDQGKFIAIAEQAGRPSDASPTEIFLPNGIRILYFGELSVSLVKTLLDVWVLS